METKITNPSDRAAQKMKGQAIQGLKAWIKALEIAENDRVSKNKYRYQIAEDGSTANIFLTADGSIVDGSLRSLADWAKIGAPSRLGLIALRFTKDELEQGGDRVEYTLNVITGEAYLSRRGVRIEDKPQTVAGWAELGRPIEKRFFQSYNMALEFNNKEAAELERARMIKYGIFRPRKNEGGKDSQ